MGAAAEVFLEAAVFLGVPELRRTVRDEPVEAVLLEAVPVPEVRLDELVRVVRAVPVVLVVRVDLVVPAREVPAVRVVPELRRAPVPLAVPVERTVPTVLIEPELRLVPVLRVRDVVLPEELVLLLRTSLKLMTFPLLFPVVCEEEALVFELLFDFLFLLLVLLSATCIKSSKSHKVPLKRINLEKRET